MKKFKRSKKTAIISGVLAVAILVGGAFAFLTDSETVTNRFKFSGSENPAQKIEVIEPDYDPEPEHNIVPTETVSKNPQVVNQGTSRSYAYIAVYSPMVDITDDSAVNKTEVFTFNKYQPGSFTATWVDAEGNALAQDATPNPATDNVVLDKSAAVRTGSFSSAWTEIEPTANRTVIKDGVTYKVRLFAYTDRLEAEGGSTDSLFDSVSLMNMNDDQLAKLRTELGYAADYTGDLDINVIVKGYTIQAEDNTDIATTAVAAWDQYVASQSDFSFAL